MPDGFHRIRYYGFLGNSPSCSRSSLQRCRELIGMAPAGPAAEIPADYRDRFEALTEVNGLCENALTAISAPW